MASEKFYRHSGMSYDECKENLRCEAQNYQEQMFVAPFVEYSILVLRGELRFWSFDDYMKAFTGMQ